MNKIKSLSPKSALNWFKIDYWKLLIDVKIEAQKAMGYAFYLAATITLVAIPIIAWYMSDSFAVFAGMSLFIFVEGAVGFLIVWGIISAILVPVWLIVWGSRQALNI
ncbi:hypothetical protein [Halorubellus sp. PRR65]|uniref:hypothetical protein n=1 Tax=Halorubellus sp. PRR65 TaxID=3098148 RepID=UPI002B25F8D7|nr:hypothetical protein [Halorubellus sp. PRR65]